MMPALRFYDEATGEFHNGIACPNWGVSLAQIDKPASVVATYERWENNHNQDTPSSVARAVMLTIAVFRDTVTGVYYAVAEKSLFFSSFGSTGYDLPHQQDSNYVFADRHTKRLRYERAFGGSFDFDPSTVPYGSPCVGTGVVNWTMWDRRKSPWARKRQCHAGGGTSTAETWYGQN